MKKFAAFILSLLYLASVTGATFSVHYCMGKRHSMSLVSVSKCSSCGMEKQTNGCCKDELKVVKVKDSHQLAGKAISIDAPVVLLNNYQNCRSAFRFEIAPQVVINNNSPPLPSSVSLSILNCVFRI